ncbi:unnamed protein product [Danaus chrysippus]|uniref:CCR4-NOT transcription complex subunit 4 n=1 Tax=Danaus chrysippus TaxID=151541 RepID=A0A8J2VWP1_9NEOP|nr:unnamed protein product [Danaus chrysippus]
MSVLNQSGEEQVECPLCMEPLEVDDLHFYPCTCGYQICRFCWNRIREGENGLCPACRKAYPENPADFTPLSQEQVAAIKTEKKAREQKRRNKTLESRRALANVRVVQNNLVFVVGLPVRLADPEILKRQEYFGKYGKIHKVVINQSSSYAGSQSPLASAYVTYVSPADALRAIQGVNNVTLDGRVLKGSLGTTKYCANFMKNQPCPKPDCMYLHELGDPKASFTKEEMHAGLHQVYERRLHQQLLQAQRDRPDERHYSDGNSNTNGDKASSKDGNQPNFIPTTVVTSSQINVVSTSKSKKEPMNGIINGSGSKEAWPSLGASPPADSPARKQNSPKPTVKSLENGISESSSPTQLQTQQSQTKNVKENNTDSKNRNSSNTNGHTSKKNKDSKSKKGNSNTSESSDQGTDEKTENNAISIQTQANSVFENDTQSYLSNELDELESDRHSLLENHDLLDSSDHSLLEDDNTHNLLNDASNEVMMMQRHREMLAGLVDNNHLLLKSLPMNGYGLSDRDIYLASDRQISQINHGMMEKELMLRDRNRSSLLMRQNEMMSRHSMEPKHYMPTSSIGLESASELLGANFHPNHSMLPPFGMRVDNSMGASSIGNTMTTLSANTLNNPITNSLSNTLASSMATNSMGSSMGLSMGSSMGKSMGGFMLAAQQLPQIQNQGQMQTGLVNGFDTTQTTSEGRYQAETMDKFFTDFHKAQQMRQMRDERREPPPHALSAERLEMEQKHRMNNMRSSETLSGRAAGDGDDDLDFDPFKETQKALAEMMETELMLNSISSGDNMERVRRSRLPPPGFSHVNTFGIGVPRHQTHHQGYSSNNAMFSDWTQMDPAIMSTSVNFGKSASNAPAGSSAALSQQQQELFARFNQLQVAANAPNGVKQSQLNINWAPQKLGWGHSVPLPPGFAPPKTSQHPAECIDAK